VNAIAVIGCNGVDSKHLSAGSKSESSNGFFGSKSPDLSASTAAPIASSVMLDKIFQLFIVLGMVS